jgi:hypothetical protein
VLVTLAIAKPVEIQPKPFRLAVAGSAARWKADAVSRRGPGNRGTSISNETMKMPTNLPHDPITASSVRATVRVLLARVCGLVNDWVAAALARRERHARLSAHRYLYSRMPSENGVHRYRIGEGPGKPVTGGGAVRSTRRRSSGRAKFAPVSSPLQTR